MLVALCCYIYIYIYIYVYMSMLLFLVFCLRVCMISRRVLHENPKVLFSVLQLCIDILPLRLRPLPGLMIIVFLLLNETRKAPDLKQHSEKDFVCLANVYEHAVFGGGTSGRLWGGGF